MRRIEFSYDNRSVTLHPHAIPCKVSGETAKEKSVGRRRGANESAGKRRSQLPPTGASSAKMPKTFKVPSYESPSPSAASTNQDSCASQLSDAASEADLEDAALLINLSLSPRIIEFNASQPHLQSSDISILPTISQEVAADSSKSKPPHKGSRRRWTPTEDRTLLEKHENLGKSWVKYREHLPQWDRSQIRCRYRHILTVIKDFSGETLLQKYDEYDTTRNIGRLWSESEKVIVAQVRQEHGKDWAVLKDRLCGKRSIQDIKRYVLRRY